MNPRRLLSGDLPAGVIAALAFLAITFLLHLPLWAGIPLAVAVYAAVTLLRPRAAEDAAADAEGQAALAAYKEALTRAQEIRLSAGRIGKPAVKAEALAFCDRADQVLAAIQADDNLPAAPIFLDRLLNPTRELVDDYVRLAARAVPGSEAALIRSETHDLPLVRKAADSFYEQLHRDSLVDLAALSETLEFNLDNVTMRVPRAPRKSLT